MLFKGPANQSDSGEELRHPNPIDKPEVEISIPEARYLKLIAVLSTMMLKELLEP